MEERERGEQTSDGSFAIDDNDNSGTNSRYIGIPTVLGPSVAGGWLLDLVVCEISSDGSRLISFSSSKERIQK